MKKILFLLAILPVFMLSSCSKDEDISPYSNEQKAVMNILNGKFEGDFKTITFKTNFSEPKYYTMNIGYDETTSMPIHGTCEMYYSIQPNDIYNQAYYINNDGKYITFYNLNGNTIGSSTKYKITVVSDKEIKLYMYMGDDLYNPFADTLIKK